MMHLGGHPLWGQLVAGASLVATLAWSPLAAADEIVITCTGCEGSATDIFLAELKRVSDAFNAEYDGQYRIEPVPFSGANDDSQSVPYYKRLAATGNLPDLFVGGGYSLTDLGKTGALVEWSALLDQDPEWKAIFYDDAFISLTDTEGHIWGIPSFRDAIGIFWNKELFANAGVADFPKSWDELIAASEKLKASGVTPIAMDGLWVTLLWWGNLIGVEPGGTEFLNGGTREGNFGANPAVVTATERLKQLYTDGYVNADSFSGDFFSADTHFVTGKAAMLANGPWEIPSGIKGSAAIPGLYDQLGYAVAPGDGLIVVSGTGSWGSGTTDPAKLEAVVAFMKFMNSPEQQRTKYTAVGGAWPTKLGLSDAELAETLDPLYLPVFKASETAAHIYPYPQFLLPTAFMDAWRNNWPAYAQGGMSTEEFLELLSDAAVAQLQ
jgi:raffinose/stachyose/melibiose transport system substrate-binding protein